MIFIEREQFRLLHCAWSGLSAIESTISIALAEKGVVYIGARSRSLNYGNGSTFQFALRKPLSRIIGLLRRSVVYSSGDLLYGVSHCPR